jgi:hypothetical protein
MRLEAIVFALFGASLASSEAAETTTYSSSPHQAVIATAVLSDVTSHPIYFTVLAGTFWSGETNRVATGSEIYYEFFGTTELTLGSKTTTLQAGEGTFIPSGAKFKIKTTDRRVTYLQFLLTPNSYTEHSDEPGGTTIEVYRSPSPIPGLKNDTYVLTLSRVTVPPQAPPDPPHRRSGAALHYVLSGVGAEITEGRGSAMGPGSVSYEPGELVYQWSNPSLKPLIYLVFNLNAKGEDPVILSDGASPPR